MSQKWHPWLIFIKNSTPHANLRTFGNYIIFMKSSTSMLIWDPTAIRNSRLGKKSITLWSFDSNPKKKPAALKSPHVLKGLLYTTIAVWSSFLSRQSNQRYPISFEKPFVKVRAFWIINSDSTESYFFYFEWGPFILHVKKSFAFLDPI